MEAPGFFLIIQFYPVIFINFIFQKIYLQSSLIIKISIIKHRKNSINQKFPPKHNILPGKSKKIKKSSKRHTEHWNKNPAHDFSKIHQKKRTVGKIRSRIS
jgi:hypothetical protein